MNFLYPLAIFDIGNGTSPVYFHDLSIYKKWGISQPAQCLMIPEQKPRLWVQDSFIHLWESWTECGHCIFLAWLLQFIPFHSNSYPGLRANQPSFLIRLDLPNPKHHPLLCFTHSLKIHKNPCFQIPRCSSSSCGKMLPRRICDPDPGGELSELEHARVEHLLQIFQDFFLNFQGFSFSPHQPPDRLRWMLRSSVESSVFAEHGRTVPFLRLFGYGSIPINTIFSGMNIHLPAILMFTRGTRFWHTAILTYLNWTTGMVVTNQCIRNVETHSPPSCWASGAPHLA